MKIGFLRVCAIAFTLFAFTASVQMAEAQVLKNNEVPKAVMDKFRSQSPKAKSPSWEKKGQDYVVTFKEDQSVTKSTYTSNGKWLKTAIEIEQEDLPINVFNVVKKEYPEYDDIIYSYLMKEDRNLQYYLVGVKISSKNILSDMRFTLIGNFVKKEEKALPSAEELSKLDNSGGTGKSKDVKEKSSSKKKGGQKTDENLISEDRVPAPVIKTFKKRLMNASEVKWYYKPGDTVYSVKCIVREQNTLGKFTDKGAWISTRTELPKDKVPSAVYKTINTFYPSYKFVSAGKELRKDKQDFYAVEIIESQYARSGDITTLYMDKSARIKFIEEPGIAVSNPATKLTAEDEKDEKKLEKEFAKDQQLDIFPVKSISPDEIPVAIHKWTDTYYPDYIYKNILYEEDEEFEDEGNIYIVLIQRPGVGQPYATVYFTRTGKFLKLVDEFRSAEEIEEQMLKNQPPPVVPMNVAEAFKARVTDANDVSWDKDEDDNWLASYKDKRELDKQTVYTDEAVWVCTRTLTPQNKVPTSIVSYIGKNFSNTEIQECWAVSDPQTKLYYHVKLYNKKNKLEFDMDFTSSGKPLE